MVDKKEKPRILPAAIFLIVTLLVDFTLPSTVGAVCGPHCPTGFSNSTVGFVAFLIGPASPWLHMPYVFGESSLDLWAAAVFRLRGADRCAAVPQEAQAACKDNTAAAAAQRGDDWLAIWNRVLCAHQQ